MQPPPSPRPAFGSPLHGNVPLGTPLPTRRARGTDSIVGLGPCPGANDLDPDTIVQKAAPVTVLTVDTVRLAKKVPPLAVELPPPSPIARLANGLVTTQPATLEVRTPGSPYVLPANPLTGLSDAALFGFVDCTLYEDPAGEDDPADGAVAEPVPVTPSMVNRVLAELEPSGPVNDRARGVRGERGTRDDPLARAGPGAAPCGRVIRRPTPVAIDRPHHRRGRNHADDRVPDLVRDRRLVS